MILYVYSTYDEKVKSFSNPFYMPTNASAIRAFTDLANNKQTTVGMHPSDFTLYQVGEWDDQTGVISHYDQHNNLGKADQYLEE